MATFVVRRALNGLRSQHSFGRCNIHLSPVVQKKKGKVVIEDLFDDSVPASEVIKEQSSSSKHKSTIASTSGPGSGHTGILEGTQWKEQKRTKLTPSQRLERFEQIVKFVEPRLGRRPAVKMPLVRNSAFVNLIGLATTEDQLREVANLMPGWKDAGRELSNAISELFIRRCEELACPLLALEVFGNFPRYNLKLTLPGARQLLHSLHVEHSIDNMIMASALYSVYSLPLISQDLVSCSLLVSACLRHNSKESIYIANTLIPHLQQLLQHTEPMITSSNPLEKSLNKPNVWTKWALKKVDKGLAKRGSRAEWLSTWRLQSGHIPELGKF